MIRNNRFTYFRSTRPLREREPHKPESMPDPRRRDPSCHERVMPVHLDEDDGGEPFDPRGGDYD